ncbi:SDR family NAD(P)-dependent oxidoreductase [Leifsonia shinshuensis]|uniref:SDR family NAD(P)-dependent oxidoreductase n=1 Tax=Leifsonia shinshuensis TaxID=150026 RepID=UPI0031E7FF31
MRDPAVAAGEGRARHVVVTGAANGIGRAIAVGFGRQSALLTLVDRDGDQLGRVATEVEVAGGRIAAALSVDLAVAASAGHVLARAWEAAPVDVLVSAAGIYPSIDVLELDAAAWDRVQAVNARAPMLLIAELARRAVQENRGANVVNISSGAAIRSRPGGSAYSTSKAALEAATRAAALELGRHSIRVNAVAPGFIPVASRLNPVTEEYAAAVSDNPLGRPGTPDDVVRAVLWLAGDDAAWVTGQTVRVDGGTSTGAWRLPRAWSDALLPQAEDA